MRGYGNRLVTDLEYKPWTFEELGYGPTLMRARHDAAQQGLMDTTSKLDFDYFDVDDEYLKPELDKLQGEIDNTTNELARKGYNPMLANKLVSLNTTYNKLAGPHGIIGRAQKNYTDAMQQWEEWKKANPKASQHYQQKAKNRFFGDYKGVYNPETKSYNQFTPGAITSERDIMEDFTDYASKAGMGSELQKALQGNVNFVPRSVNGVQMLQIEESTPGIIGSNKPQLEALVNQFMGEYTNKNTDRGLYADIAGLTPEHIQNTLSNMSKVMSKEEYKHTPTWNASVQVMPEPKTEKDGKSTTPTNPDFLQYGTLDVNVENVKKKYNNYRKALDANGNFKTEKTPDTKGKINLTGGYPTTDRQIELNIENETYKNFNKLKQDKADLYNATRNDGVEWGGKLYKGDKGFIDLSEQIDVSNQVIRGTELGVNNPTYSKSLFFSISDTEDEPMFIQKKDNGRIGKSLTKDKVKNDLKIADDAIFYRIDSDGNIRTTINNEEYTVNPKLLPRESTAYNDNIKELQVPLNKYNMTKNDINKFNSETYYVGDAAYRWQINPDNPLDKKLYRLYKVDGQLGVKETTLADVQTEAATQKYISQKPVNYSSK